MAMYLDMFHADFNLAEREKYFDRVKTWQVIDAKSVYDHLRSMNPGSGCDDRRTGLDCIVAQECLKRIHCTLRWGPGAVQLADCLTKDCGDAADTWRGFLREGRYKLASESEALAVRAHERVLRKQRAAARQAASEVKGTSQA